MKHPPSSHTEKVGTAISEKNLTGIEEVLPCLSGRAKLRESIRTGPLPKDVLAAFHHARQDYIQNEQSKPMTSATERFCDCIVSGGQTGADRGALDFAIQHGYSHGGWAPHGRQAEDGLVPLKYQLTELTDGGYRQRTLRNVQDSDGTLIVNLGELDGGTLATRTFADRMSKPYLVVQLDTGTKGEAADRVLAWLFQHSIERLNVAGPRESKRPGIYRLTIELLQAVDEACRMGTSAEE